MNNLSAVLYGTQDLRIEQRPRPVPGAGQVLVEVEAVGICGSDIHYYDHGGIGRTLVATPMIIGHEAAGTIIEIGAGVEPDRVGQRVALEPGVPDRTCKECLAGRYNLCPNIVFFATPPVDGAISRYVLIDSLFAHSYPKILSAEQAAMAEPVSVGVWAAQKAEIAPGDRVLVTGAGPIGLFAAQVARAFGATSVTVTDISDYRLGVARDLGFFAINASNPLDGQFDVLIECSGSSVALKSALTAMAPAGRIVLVGIGASDVSLDLSLLQSRELTINGIFRYANTYPLALSMIASGAVETDTVITHHFGIEKTEDALTLGKRDPHSLKAVVLPLT